MAERGLVFLGLVMGLTACGTAPEQSSIEDVVDDPNACADVEFPDSRWNDTIRAQVRAGVLATGGPTSDPELLAQREHIADRVLASLERYANQWTYMRRDACMDTRVEKIMSEQDLAKADACFVAHLAWHETIVEVASAPPANARIGDYEGNVRAMQRVTELCLYEAYYEVFEDSSQSAADVHDAIAESRAYRWFHFEDRAVATAQRALDGAGSSGKLRAEALSELAASKEDLDRDEAERLAREMLRESERSDYELGAAWAQQMFGRVAYAREKYDEAIAHYKKVLPEYERLLTSLRPEYNVCLTDLSLAYWGAGDLDRAREIGARTVRDAEAMYGPDHPDTGSSYDILAGILEAHGELDLALTNYEQALRIRREVMGNEHPYTATTVAEVGVVLDLLGRSKEALPVLEEALAMRRRILGDDHYDTGVSYSNLGAALFNLSDHSASLKAFAAAEAIFRKTGSRVDVANVVEWTASIHQAQGKHDLALTELDEVLDIRKTELGANHPYTAEVHVNMANSRYAKGDVSGAIACLRDALRAYKAADTRDPQAIEYVRTSIVALCQQDPTCDRP